MVWGCWFVGVFVVKNGFFWGGAIFFVKVAKDAWDNPGCEWMPVEVCSRCCTGKEGVGKRAERKSLLWANNKVVKKIVMQWLCACVCCWVPGKAKPINRKFQARRSFPPRGFPRLSG
jgi:hypothetical protein